MCGIAGMVRLDGGAVDPGALDTLTDALAHRGPDGRGVYIHGNVGIGHRRLKIIDLSTAAAQPMISGDGNTILTFNGEIYNFRELRTHLEAKGRRFRSQSDTEVLLQLYEEEGVDCLQKLRGMFAFCVYDKRKSTLTLVRDRVGKKPIKYFLQNGLFAFASELKALKTLPECPRSVDLQAVHDVLSLMYLPSPRTGITGIHKLPAGHVLTLDLQSGTHHVRPFWELRYETKEDISSQEWQKRIAGTLRESVSLRMVSDVPLGAFLSGGIDSSSVVALMSALSATPVKTFSAGTNDEESELPDAERISRYFHTDHHALHTHPDIRSLLPTLVATYEEPFADPSTIPTYLLARETRKFVTVALTGDGGDENFAGYVRYPILLFSERWARLPRAFHALLKRGTGLLHRLSGTTLSYRINRFEQSIDLPWEQRFLQYVSFFTESEKSLLERRAIAHDRQRTDAWFAKETTEARNRGADNLHKAMSMDFTTYLADNLMPKVDLGSMAHGLEARSPYLDHEFLELTAQIPSRYLLKGHKGKWILRKWLKTVLPADALRKPKRGFRLPLDHWFRTDLAGWVRERLLTGNTAFWEIFEKSQVESFLQTYTRSRVDYSDHLWSLLWLQEWLEQQEQS